MYKVGTIQFYAPEIFMNGIKFLLKAKRKPFPCMLPYKTSEKLIYLTSLLMKTGISLFFEIRANQF